MEKNLNHENYIQLSGEIFEKVQHGHLFKDSKLFVDAIPLDDIQTIHQKYCDESKRSNFDLKAFIQNHFTFQAAQEEHLVCDDMYAYIEKMWDLLTKDFNDTLLVSSLIPLPKPHIVPGGRFQEIYYWDSFFVSLGLIESKRTYQLENLIENFAHLIRNYGHIPNGNRIYYYTRSQQPYFSLLVSLLDEEKGLTYFYELKKEYDFWMQDGAHFIASEGLNRYWDPLNLPRPESYFEDTQLYQQANPEEKQDLYHHIRASCESGWDFSSRFFRDKHALHSICTCEILPIDLNCLIYDMEIRLSIFSKKHNKPDLADLYNKQAQKRKEAINRYFWNENKGFYFDFSWKEKKQTAAYSLAAVFPLFFHLATQEQAEAVKKQIENAFLFDGGLITTLEETGQQWDSPNGWAPLQYIAVKGLSNYGFKDLAKTIAKRWLMTNELLFKKTGKILEKYDVMHPGKLASGGEYELQEGFGWTNGVAVNFKKFLCNNS